MIISVDPAAPVPPYEQLRSQVATMVASGVLPPGTRLPAIRQLAADLALAAGTVARAYRELEHEGVIESRGRHGTFTCVPPAPADGAVDGRLEKAARAFAVAALQLGKHREDAVAALERALAALARVPRPE